MRMGITRRFAFAAVCCVSLLALATLVAGWPSQPPHPFGPLAMGGSDPIWTGPPPVSKHMGVSTTTSSGRTRTQGFLQGVLQSGGMSPAGYTLILEGTYDSVNATGQQDSTSGVAVLRWPDDPDTSADRTIGSGGAALPTANPATYKFYGVVSASPRVAMVHAGLYDVWATDGSNNLVAVDANDATICAKTTTAFGLNGRGTVSYSVSDVRPTMTPITGSCLCNPAGDTDSMTGDGTIGLSVTLTAGASNGGNVSVSCTAGQPATANLAPGTSQTFTGNLTLLEWTYAGAGSTISWSVKGD